MSPSTTSSRSACLLDLKVQTLLLRDEQPDYDRGMTGDIV